MNLFLEAARQQFRFNSVKGVLTVEDLFQLPLNSERGASLNDVAVRLSKEIEAQGQGSFFAATPNRIKAQLEQKLEIVKEIGGIKQAEADRARKRAERNAERTKLLTILANKEDQELQSASKEELLKRLEALEEAEV